ncbi:MAG: cysteine desulfurase [Algicola sp.]|nr:cysteine desulfurase [Algicola sp.]
MLKSLHSTDIGPTALNDTRKFFPALQNNTAYLDSASTCQVPTTVIDAISTYLSTGHGNAQRGMYQFSENASNLHQLCREKVAEFINAPQGSDIIFTKSATESINLVAHSLRLGLRQSLTPEHSILITVMEHHANLLPWQRLCQQTGARLNILPINKNGVLDSSALETYLNDNCALFAITHISNVTGIVNDVKSLCKTGHQYKVPVLIDGAQAVGHRQVDVSQIDCDYYVFSGHKMYAATGIGVLYCKSLDNDPLEPLLLGGGIVNKVTLDSYKLKPTVEKFEAGSANMLGIVGLIGAIEFIDNIGWPALNAHERKVSGYLLNALRSIEGIKVLPNDAGSAVISFVHQQVHSHDVASILALENVAVRAGHHCAQPYLKAMGFKHCVRVSLGCYSSFADVDRLVVALGEVEVMFAGV